MLIDHAIKITAIIMCIIILQVFVKGIAERLNRCLSNTKRGGGGWRRRRPGFYEYLSRLDY